MTLISDPTDGSEIPRPTTWHVWNPVNNGDNYHISWLAGFLNHHQYDNKSSMILFYKASELVLECLLEDRHMSMMPRMKLRRRSTRNKPSGPSVKWRDSYWIQPDETTLSEQIRCVYNSILIIHIVTAIMFPLSISATVAPHIATSRHFFRVNRALRPPPSFISSTLARWDGISKQIGKHQTLVVGNALEHNYGFYAYTHVFWPMHAYTHTNQTVCLGEFTMLHISVSEKWGYSVKVLKTWSHRLEGTQEGIPSNSALWIIPCPVA